LQACTALVYLYYVYVMNTSREDIISRYRDRIDTGKRTKLTDAEQTQLIEAFVEHLRSLTTEAEIKALCESELDLMEEGYQKATIAKDRLRYYRTAVKTAMTDGKLPMTAETSRVYSYTPRGSDELIEAHDHRSLDYLKYDAATYREIAVESSQRNNRKQDNLKPVSLAAYLSKASELLRSDDPFDLIVGVAALTGRRFSEVVDKGTLQATDDPYSVTFVGQTKKKEEADSYLIPCLIPSVDVLSALERFRRHPRISKLNGMSASSINRSLANSIKLTVQRHFGSIVPTLEGESAVTIHNLRGVYAEIAVHYFCPPDRGVARYVQERLGHVISAQELKRPNASATQHYFHYFLTDGDGKHIGEKGVKLDQGKALPTQESQPEKSIEPLPKPQANATEERESISEIANLTHQLKHLAQEVNRIWSYINTMTLTTQTQASISVENLQSQLAAMEYERDQTSAQLEQLKAENEALKQQVSQIHQAYQQRIEGLTELIKQSPSIAQPSANQLVESTLTRAATMPAPKPQIATLKREHITTTGTADQRVEAAMRLLMQWNREHDSDSNKFAITQSLLQKTTGSNMPAVKRVMEAFRNEIYEHNSEYALDPDRHNYGKDVEEIKEWVKTRL